MGKTLYHQGDLSYFEAVNKETLKNSYQRFEEEGIVYTVKSKDSKSSPPQLRLSSDWMPTRDAISGRIVADGRLWTFTERIAMSRREGKNRRDGATVSTRVLMLTDELGKKLFEEAKAKKEDGSGKMSAEEMARAKKDVKEERKRRTLEGRARL